MTSILLSPLTSSRNVRSITLEKGIGESERLAGWKDGVGAGVYWTVLDKTFSPLQRRKDQTNEHAHTLTQTTNNGITRGKSISHVRVYGVCWRWSRFWRWWLAQVLSPDCSRFSTRSLSRCGNHTRECVGWNGRKFDGNDDDSKRVSDETLRGWDNCIFNTIQLRHSQNCMKIRAARNKFYIYIHLRLKSNCTILNSESFTIQKYVDDIERTEHRI